MNNSKIYIFLNCVYKQTYISRLAYPFFVLLSYGALKNKNYAKLKNCKVIIK